MICRSTTFALALLTASLGSARADLPVLTEKPFLGCFAGFEGRDSLYKVGDDGKLDVNFLDDDGDSLNLVGAKVVFFLQEGNVSKQFDRSELQTDQEATDEPETMSFIATASNEAKVKVTYHFKDSQVYFDIEIVDNGKATKPLTAGFLCYLRPVYPSVLSGDVDEEKLEKAVKGDRMTMRFSNGKSLKAKLHESYTELLEEDKENVETGYVKATLKAKSLGKADFEIGLREAAGAKMTFVPGGGGDYVARNGNFRITRDPNSEGTGPLGYVEAK